MTSCEPVRRPTAATTVEVDDLADLAAILEPDTHIAVWRRPVDDAIQALLTRPDCRLNRPARTTATSVDDDLDERIADLIPTAAAAADPHGAAALARDIRLLTRAFADLVAANELMISLEGPDEATCPRFHVDRVGIRMLVTYCGPGTEWLADGDVDRRWLGKPGMDLPDDQNGVIRAGAVVHRVPTFAVVLLKGEAWPGAAGFGAVHRSPDPGGEARALLRVDMLSQLPVEPTEDER